MAKTFVVVLKGENEFKRSLYEDMAKADLAARNIVTKGAFIIEGAAKEQIRPRPAGSQRKSQLKTYKGQPNKNFGRTYYAGPAFPPMPTMRTGHLQKSIRERGVWQLGKGRWTSITGPSVKYAGYVEYGTSRSRKFPYMEDGVRKSEHRIDALAREEWAAALR